MPSLDQIASIFPEISRQIIQSLKEQGGFIVSIYDPNTNKHTYHHKLTIEDVRAMNLVIGVSQVFTKRELEEFLGGGALCYYRHEADRLLLPVQFNCLGLPNRLTKPLRMMIDTGSPKSIVFVTFAEWEDVKKIGEPDPFTGFGTKREDKYKVTIADLCVANDAVTWSKSMLFTPTEDWGIDGAIGMDILQYCSVSFHGGVASFHVTNKRS